MPFEAFSKFENFTSTRKVSAAAEIDPACNRMPYFSDDARNNDCVLG